MRAMRSFVAAALALIAFVAPAHTAPWTITVTGTVYSNAFNQIDLFATSGELLVGLPFTETITTDPLLNTHSTDPNPIYQEYNGGAGLPDGCCGAPYTLTTTINGVTFTATELNPRIVRSYLASGLGSGLGSPDVGTDQDQVYQEVGSGCSSSYGPCTNSYILAYSRQGSFVPSLDFQQTIFASGT